MAKNLSSLNSGSVHWICFANLQRLVNGDNWCFQGVKVLHSRFDDFHAMCYHSQLMCILSKHREECDYRRLIDGEWSFGGYISCLGNKILWIKFFPHI